MPIHEERDIVLTKIYAFSQRDRFVSRALIIQELEMKKQLSRRKSESAIWFLSDFGFIIQDQENRNHIRLTPLGIKLIKEGGFEQQRLNNRRDLKKKIDELSQQLSKLEERIAALEEPAELQEEPVTIQEQERPFRWWVALTIVFLFLATFCLFCWYGPTLNF